MDFESNKLLFNSNDVDSLCDLCGQKFSKAFLMLVGIAYITFTFLSLFLDISTWYDLIGIITVGLTICSNLPYVRTNVRSIVHVFIILTWTLIYLITSLVCWGHKDKRFEQWPSFILYVGQGIQISILLWVNLIMIRSRKHYKLSSPQNIFPTLLTLFGWVLALIGLTMITIYANNLKKYMEEANANLNYVGELIMWLGLSLSALSSGPEMRPYELFAIAPFSFMVPILYL